MEKYSSFRDRGSGIAPFFPVPTDPSGLYLPFHIFLFACRLPLLVFFLVAYFCFLQWLPIGSLVKKAVLWCIIGTPGIWWIDLQIDGVRRGSLASNSARIPQPGTIIASSYTSPLDALYLAAIFDPVFTTSYPNTRLMQQVSLFRALLHAFSSPQSSPPPEATLLTLPEILKANPDRVVVVFPECTTTNGRGILPFSPSLLSSPPKTKIFPTSLRYTAADITTPIPYAYTTFLWNLLSKPTHSLRVRIAESVTITHPVNLGYGTNYLDTMNREDMSSSEENTVSSDGGDGNVSGPEKKVLDKIGEALARLGRVKRVGLGVREKTEFVRVRDKVKSR